MFAMPVCALSGSIVQLLGMKHFHHPVAVVQDDPMAGWMDMRRVVPPNSGDAHSDSRAHAHAHATLQRHHHAADDSTVASLDGTASDHARSGEGGASAAEAAAHAVALLDRGFITMLQPATVTWALPAQGRITSRPPGRLERPPRA